MNRTSEIRNFQGLHSELDWRKHARAGRVVTAIKYYRMLHGVTLLKAKNVVDAYVGTIKAMEAGAAEYEEVMAIQAMMED